MNIDWSFKSKYYYENNQNENTYQKQFKERKSD